MLDFVLVVPTLNEGAYVGSFLAKSKQILPSIFKNYKIVVIDASSSDSTVEIAESFSDDNNDIDIIKGRIRGRRGLDVMYAMSKYKSHLYCYIDADLVDSLGSLGEAINKSEIGYDLVLGSRYVEGSVLDRPKLRKSVSIIYNKAVNLLFGDTIHDHQCGYKIFSTRAFRLMLKNAKEPHWVWDTETILIANYKHLKIAEIPIRWTEKRSKNTDIIRLAKDISLFIPGILRVRYRLWEGL